MGRIHTKEELNASVSPSGVPKEEIAKMIFDLEQTKKYENLDVMNKKIVVDKDGNFIEFAGADNIEKETRPDSVETIIIDLTKTLIEIEADFSKTTRNLIRRAEKENFIFREIGFNERQLVYDVLEELEDLKDIKLVKSILQIRAPFLDGIRRMYVVENKEKRPLAVALVTIQVDNFVYTLGGVTQEGRDTCAGYFLIWNLIKDAKELGYKTFDLGGIYADWADDEKKKVNSFKMKWGGRMVPLDISSR